MRDTARRAFTEQPAVSASTRGLDRLEQRSPSGRSPGVDQGVASNSGSRSVRVLQIFGQQRYTHGALVQRVAKKMFRAVGRGTRTPFWHAAARYPHRSSETPTALHSRSTLPQHSVPARPTSPGADRGPFGQLAEVRFLSSWWGQREQQSRIRAAIAPAVVNEAAGVMDRASAGRRHAVEPASPAPATGAPTTESRIAPHRLRPAQLGEDQPAQPWQYPRYSGSMIDRSGLSDNQQVAGDLLASGPNDGEMKYPRSGIDCISSGTPSQQTALAQRQIGARMAPRAVRPSGVLDKSVQRPVRGARIRPAPRTPVPHAVKARAE